MAAKGSCKDCCCNACEVNPTCGECCRCVPRTLCARLTWPGGADCSCARRSGDDDTAASVAMDWDCGAQRYAGTLTCGDLSIDVTFYFTRREYDGQCLFCLESSCLGLTGDDRLCHEVESGQCRDPEFSFAVDVSGCGDPYCGPAVISTSKADRIVFRRRGCDPDCPDCKCACRCLCVEYTDGYGCAADGLVCWDVDEDAWLGSLACDVTGETHAFRLEVRDDGYGLCVLAAEVDGEPFGTPVPVADCTALGSIFTQGDRTLTVVCTDCGECFPPEKSECLCDGVTLVTTPLYATVTDAGGCPCVGSAGPLVLKLVWLPTAQMFRSVATYRPSPCLDELIGDCPDPAGVPVGGYPHGMRIELPCDALSLSLAFRVTVWGSREPIAVGCMPITAVAPTLTLHSCDPFHATVTGVNIGPTCNGQPLGELVDIEITE